MGFVGLGAAVTVLADHSNQQAALGDGVRVRAASAVNVSAVSNRTLSIDTGQINAGAVAAGASFTRLSTDGNVSADIGHNARIGQDAGLSVGTLNLDAQANIDAEAFTVAVSAGAVAVSANFAFVDVTPTLRAGVGNGALVDVTGDATIDNVSTGRAEATVNLSLIHISEPTRPY